MKKLFLVTVATVALAYPAISAEKDKKLLPNSTVQTAPEHSDKTPAQTHKIPVGESGDKAMMKDEKGTVGAAPSDKDETPTIQSDDRPGANDAENKGN